MTVIYDPQRAGQIERAAVLLSRGECVALPTETVYGLAGRALDTSALAKIFALKARPTFDPLIVHVNSRDELAPLVKSRSSLHERLIEAFWPGPLTLLFEKSERVPDLCTAATPWVALRSPEHPVFRRAIELVGSPLAAPSANRFGRISPTEAQHVVDELGPFGLEAVVDGGPCRWGVESTVVKVHGEFEVEIVRVGALSHERLAEVLGPQVALRVRASGTGALEESPGQLASHYAPRKALRFVSDASELASLRGRTKALVLPLRAQSAGSLEGWGECHVLSERSSDVEAAAALFRELRRADAGPCQEIVALAAPPAGLGLAINDRLRRAASPRPRG